MSKLIIVESPSKATTIEKYLGHDYKVVSSKGHIRDLAISGKGGLGIDIEHDFKPTYVDNKDKTDVIKQLGKEIKKADEVILATDPDREGEAIAWHIADRFDLPLTAKNRVVFHEITKPVVTEAVKEPKSVDMQMVSSQETRRMLDRIIGFELSTLLKNKIKSRSAGRVQSVALKLICEREEEIKRFKPEEYWTIDASFKHERKTFGAELTKIGGQKAKVTDEKSAMEIKDNCLGQPFTVDEIKEEVKYRAARPPYTTSTLQQDAANKLYFSSKKTMRLAQKLYEGVQIASGLTGLITYMRTDSTRLSDVFLAQGAAVIAERYGRDYVGGYKAKTSRNAQDAHEAIRPTSLNNVPEEIKEFLSGDEYKLYRMIYYRALAAMMKATSYKAVTVRLLNGDYEFTAAGHTQIFDGYLKAYGDYETSEDKALPSLETKQQLKAEKIEAKQHFTEPPARYTEARLIKTMEENGIGRPSTYASIIDTILARKYVTHEKSSESSRVKVFVPTEQGILTTEKLDEFFSSIINTKYTSEMESELDQIADGELNSLTALKKFYGEFEPLMENARKNMEKLAPVKTGEKCPECGGDLVYREGKFGKFISCSNYPTCRYTANLNGESNKEPAELEKTGDKCPECGSDLVYRQGRFGKFISCENYPKCKFTAKLPKDKPEETGELCPECGSPLVKRKNRFGQSFIGCSNYPKCRFIKKDESAPKRTTRKKKENAEG